MICTTAYFNETQCGQRQKWNYAKKQRKIMLNYAKWNVKPMEKEM